DNPQALAFLATFNANTLWTNFLCLLVGLVVTVIIQSSSATTAIILTMGYNGWVGVEEGAAMILGAMIGTTITAYLASIGTSTTAKQAAWAHILFNVFGSSLALIFFRPLLTLVNWIVPGDVFALTGEALAQALPVFLAMFATVAALSKTILMFPFVTPYARLIERLFPQKAEYEEGTYHFRYIGAPFIDSPEIYMLAIRDEIKKMANLACTMLARYRSMFDSPNNAIDDLVDLMRRDEEYADQMQEQLSNFIVHLLQDSQTTTNASSLNSLIRVMDELESVTDSCYALARLSQRRYKMGWNYEDEILKEMETFHLIVQEFLNYVRDRMDRTLTKAEMQKANEYEDQINALRADLGNKVQDRLSEGVGDVKAELLILELIRHLEHIGDYCTNIAEAYHQAVKHTPVLQKRSQRIVETA
ncbi:MAG: Na/Pi symporter, partial [Spirochaetota bacterium]|nr:Na/Pi symporter [Spirochaetota bacterium]